MSAVHKGVRVTVATSVEANRVEIKIDCPDCGTELVSLSAAHLPILAAILGEVMDAEGMEPVEVPPEAHSEVVPDAEARARLSWKPH